MPHDLLITYKIEVEDKFSPFLKPNDAVRGEPYLLTLAVTNLGKDNFPGGTIKDLKIRYNMSGGGTGAKTTFLSEELPKCPKIEPTKTETLFSTSLIALDEGVARISVVLEAEDKEPIKYYQTPNVPLPGEWLNFFHVVNREQLLIVMYLQQLLESLHKS